MNTPTALGDLVPARARLLLLPAMRGLQAEANLLTGAGRAAAGFRLGTTNGTLDYAAIGVCGEASPTAVSTAASR